MKLLIVGSIGLDTVQTPFGKNRNAPGGSAIYAALSASYFTDTKIVSIIGTDFPKKYLKLLKAKNIDSSGILRKKGKTFRWEGSYGWNFDSARTIATHLNLLKDFNPALTEQDKRCKFVFLANNDPELQLKIIKQLRCPKLIAADTIEFWINNKKAKLIEVLKKIDILVINEGEARLLTKEPNLIAAAKKIVSYGTPRVIIKKGEHGLLYVAKNKFFSYPAYPLERVCDPTGAGDSFAGAFLGYLSVAGSLNETKYRKALIAASAVASYNVEGFDIRALSKLNKPLIDKRCREFRELTRV